MIDLNIINDDCVLICPNELKNALIQKKSLDFPTKRIKFISKSEVLNNGKYNYDFKAILYLKDKYHYSFDNAEEILNNLYDVDLSNSKFKKLSLIIDDLKEQNLISKNNYFKYLFNNKKCFIYGYSKNDEELKYFLAKLNINYQYLEDKIEQNFSHTIINYETLEDEVRGLFIKIMTLIKNGVNLNNIYLYKFPSDYNFILKKYAYYHNIPIEFEDDIILYDAPLFKKYLTYLNDLDFKDALDKLKLEVKKDHFGVINAIVNNLNQFLYLKLEKEKAINALIYLSKKTLLKKIKYEESIKICSFSSFIKDDDYVFMLGFSLGDYPNIYKDIDFFTDKEKSILHLNSSKLKTQINYEQLEKFILTTKNLRISFKEKYNNTRYFKSLLKDKLNLKEEKYIDEKNRYSKNLCEIEIANYIDDYYKYGTLNKFMKTFDEKNLNYNLYDHRFKGLKPFELPMINLSYSQINNYNTCPFMYFVKRFLKLDTSSDTFELNVGNLFHKILEDSLTKEISLNDYEEFINEKFKTPKDLFFLYRLLPQVEKVIQKNKKFLLNSDYQKQISEKVLKIDIDNDLSINGKIDKIMIDENNKSLIVVDYKTGNFAFNINKVNYGINLQLPLYSLLLKDSFKNYHISGIYIQNILVNEEKNDDYNYLLNGFSFDEKKLINIDRSLGTYYHNKKCCSEFLSGIILNKDGTLSKLSQRKIYDEEKFSKLLYLTKEQIKKTAWNIKSLKFDIRPIKFNSENLPCENCNCLDICFKKAEDVFYVDLKEEKKDEI